jgi:hypothetical protein
MIVVNIITFIENMVTNGIYDYAIFVSSGNFYINIWTIKSFWHGQSYMCLRTTMLVACVLRHVNLLMKYIKVCMKFENIWCKFE